ncbi:MAG: SdrD B-like domain-containing protein, partial [Bacteroidota bacterium]
MNNFYNLGRTGLQSLLKLSPKTKLLGLGLVSILSFGAIHLSSGESLSNLFFINTNLDKESAAPLAMMPPCGGAAGEIGGTAFLDMNDNGVDNTEVGQEGIIVEVFDCDGTRLCNTTTDSDGNWSCTGLTDGADYLVEFSFPNDLDYLSPSRNGNVNNTDVQTITAPSCDADFGVFDPMRFCRPGPQGQMVVAGCARNNTDVVSLVSWHYYNDRRSSIVGSTVTPHNQDLRTFEVGIPMGITMMRGENIVLLSTLASPNETIFPTAPDGIDVIYAVDHRSGGNNTPSEVLVNLGDLGINVSGATRFGQYGIGGLATSVDGKTLYGVNMAAGNIFAIDISDVDYDQLPATAPTTVSEITIPTGITNCTGGVFRPSALKVEQGKLFIAGVCDASAGVDADLEAIVLSYDPENEQFEQVFSFEPNTFQAGGLGLAQRNWDQNKWEEVSITSGLQPHFQPFIMDLEFDDEGSIFFGVVNRVQFITNNAVRNHTGYFVRTYRNPDGSFTLENNGLSGPYTSQARIHPGTGIPSDPINHTNSGGPGNKWFYEQGMVSHPYLFNGGVFVLPGTGEVLAGFTDPMDLSQLGVRYFDIETGETEFAAVFSGNKVVRLTGVEVLCNGAIIEIGNYVWEDLDQDGFQDPCEPAISGLPVTLIDKANDAIVAVTTTNANGEYYFVESTNGLQQNTEYAIVFGYDGNTPSNSVFDPATGKISIGGVDYNLTTNNSTDPNSSDSNDSDASIMTAVGLTDYPMIMYTTSTISDHSLDVGLLDCAPIVADPSPIAGTCDMNDLANDDASFSIGSITDGDRIGIVQGTDYMGGPDYGAAIDLLGATSYLFENLIHNTDYTVRVFNGGDDCFTDVSFNVTLLCSAAPAAACVDGPGIIGGMAFFDANNDGISTEGGQEGIVVQVFDCDDLLVGWTSTGPSGEWSAEGLTDGENYRVEFSFPEDGSLDHLAPSYHGTNHGTDVQFVTSPSCEVDFGVLEPETYCQELPRVVFPCYVNGGLNATAPVDVLVSFQYGDTGSGGVNKVVEATKSQIGTVWGVAYDKERDLFYTSAFLRRHAAVGPEGLGAIYVTTPGLPADAALLVNVPNPGTIDDVARNLGAPSAPAHDDEALAKVGRVGLGDLDISQEDDLLFTVNLNTKELITIDLTTSAITNTQAIPQTVCNAAMGEAIPFGLKVHRGKVYVGMICNAMFSRNRDDLKAAVLEYDIAAETFAADPVLEFDLNYLKGSNTTGTGVGLNGEPLNEHANKWYPWLDTFEEVEMNVFVAGNLGIVTHSTPILSDIEFDADNRMILGFADRTGYQYSFNNLLPSSHTGSYTLDFTFSGGDLLRADQTAANEWTIESTIAAGDEFYFGEVYPSPQSGFAAAHEETAQGGVFSNLIRDEVIISAMDPLVINSGGAIYLDNTTGGQSQNGYQLYAGIIGQGLFGKAAGLADVEGVCDPLPIEIGNYVWFDDDEDGVQDACELPVTNLPVTLINKVDNSVVAVTTTDANGEYYFNETDDGLLQEMEYAIVFGYDANTPANNVFDPATGMFPIGGVDYALAAADNSTVGQTDQNDSDASIMSAGGLESYPIIMYTTGTSSDHTLDVGLVDCAPTFASATGLQGTCDMSDMPNSDAGITVTGIVDGDRIGIFQGNGYAGGPDYAAAIDLMGADSYTFENLDHLVPYTIRIFNGSDNCFIDVQETINILCSPLPPVPCVDGPGTLGGMAFLDADNNGVQIEGGQEGIVVQVYNCDGNLVGWTSTDSNGEWSVADLTDGEDYRVEFSFPEDGSLDQLSPSYQGTDNGTDVQFVSSPSCEVDFGVIEFEDCEDVPAAVFSGFL